MNILRYKKFKAKAHRNDSEMKEEIEQISQSLLNDFKMLVNDVFKLERKADPKTSMPQPRKKRHGSQETLTTKTNVQQCGESVSGEYSGEHQITESDLDSQIAPTSVKCHEKALTTKSLHFSYGKSSKSQPKLVEVLSNDSKETLGSKKAEQPLLSSSESQPPSSIALKPAKNLDQKQFVKKIISSQSTKKYPPKNVQKHKVLLKNNCCTKCNHPKDLSKMFNSNDNKINPANKNKDKVDRFTEHLGRKLRRMEPLQRILTERIIAEVCSYARKERLTVGSIGKLAALFMISEDPKYDENLSKTKVVGEKTRVESRHDESQKPELTNADIDAIVRREKALLAQYVEL